MGKSPHPYEGTHDGFHVTRPFTGHILPFKLQLGRDNLYERMHGLPKYSKEQLNIMQKQYNKSVDFREFLPNSVINSPKQKLHTHSFTTKSLGLYQKRHSYSSYGVSRATTMTTTREDIEKELY